MGYIMKVQINYILREVFLMKKNYSRIFILMLVCVMVAFAFNTSSVFAETNDGDYPPISTYNQSATNNFIFGGEVIEYTITAANYLAGMADRVGLVIKARDGSLPSYKYSLSVTFFDNKGVPKAPQQTLKCEEYINSPIDTAVECPKGWEWACEYVEYDFSITCNGETKSSSGTLFFA